MDIADVGLPGQGGCRHYSGLVATTRRRDNPRRAGSINLELAMTHDQMQDHLRRANDAVDDHDVALAVRLLIKVVQALIPRGREPSP